MLLVARLAAVVAVAVSLAACSSARIVHDTRTGGTVALRGIQDDAHEKAEVLMKRKCPAGYSVVEQREVPYGETTSSSTDFYGGRRGRSSAYTRSTTTQQTEWQIVFQCNGTQASAPQYVIRF